MRSPKGSSAMQGKPHYGSPIPAALLKDSHQPAPRCQGLSILLGAQRRWEAQQPHPHYSYGRVTEVNLPKVTKPEFGQTPKATLTKPGSPLCCPCLLLQQDLGSLFQKSISPAWGVSPPCTPTTSCRKTRLHAKKLLQPCATCPAAGLAAPSKKSKLHSPVSEHGGPAPKLSVVWETDSKPKY